MNRTAPIENFSAGGVSELQSHVIANSPAICAILDATGQALVTSEGFHDQIRVLGKLPVSGLVGLTELCPNTDWSRELDRARIDGLHGFDCWLDRPSGRVHMQITLSHTPECEPGQEACFLLFAQDLGNSREVRNYQSLIAFQDRLTGLYNRRFLETTMPDRIAAQTAAGLPLGFALIDINGVEDLHDRHGAARVDALFKMVAKGIGALIPADATLVYYAPGEFVILLEGASASPRLATVAEAIKLLFAQGVTIEETRIPVDLSIGLSFFPEHGRSLAQLLHHADEAIFQAASCEPSGEPRGFREMAVNLAKAPASAVYDLSLGLAGSQFRPFYQEIVDLKTGACIGAEALCRWLKAEQTVVHPVEFMSRAENFGLISEIDRGMFHHICKDVSEGTSPKLSNGLTSFNVSATTLGQPSFMPFLKETLARFDLRPDQFCIELVESTFLVENDPGRACLFALKDMGFSIALDDFGTGFSSLALLKDLPISRLKVDRSFVRDLPTSKRDQSIVDSILKLCRAIETEVVVEGIESPEQRDTLTAMQAKFGQGFLLGRPRPVDQY